MNKSIEAYIFDLDGCIYSGNELYGGSNDVLNKIRNDGKKIIFVAYYLDKLGIKGNLKIGGAQVSFKHANMIVTDETATSTDIINLVKKIQKLMIGTYGIKPIPECQLIGF